MRRTDDIDFARVFDALPNPCLLLDRGLSVVGANRAYLAATMAAREAVVGHHLLDLFGDDPGGARELRASLERVLATRAPDEMAVQEREARRPDGRFEKRRWALVNTPVLDRARPRTRRTCGGGWPRS